MNLTQAISALVTVASGLSGIVRAYDDPPESISEFPCAMVYAEAGILNAEGTNLGRGTHTIRIDLYASRTQLPQAVNTSRGWPDALHSALATNERLGGSASIIEWPVRYQAVSMQYNNLTHYGMRFEVTVNLFGGV